MSKYISDKSKVSAWIVLKKNKLIAKVHSYYTASSVTVNVFNYGNGECFQRGKASGYGYDKFVAALRGLIIDGIPLNDHCETNEKTKKLLKQYIDHKINRKFTNDDVDYYRDQASKLGAKFVNMQTYYDDIVNYNFKGDKTNVKVTGRYSNLHLDSGLTKLTTLGYTVIQAI